MRASLCLGFLVILVIGLCFVDGVFCTAPSSTTEINNDAQKKFDVVAAFNGTSAYVIGRTFVGLFSGNNNNNQTEWAAPAPFAAYKCVLTSPSTIVAIEPRGTGTTVSYGACSVVFPDNQPGIACCMGAYPLFKVSPCNGNNSPCLVPSSTLPTVWYEASSKKEQRNEQDRSDVHYVMRSSDVQSEQEHTIVDNLPSTKTDIVNLDLESIDQHGGPVYGDWRGQIANGLCIRNHYPQSYGPPSTCDNKSGVLKSSNTPFNGIHYYPGLFSACLLDSIWSCFCTYVLLLQRML